MEEDNTPGRDRGQYKLYLHPNNFGEVPRTTKWRRLNNDNHHHDHDHVELDDHRVGGDDQNVDENYQYQRHEYDDDDDADNEEGNIFEPFHDNSTKAVDGNPLQPPIIDHGMDIYVDY